MLLLNPTSVSFDAAAWPDATAIAIDRKAQRSVIHWTDFGPYAVFADVPEQAVAITITRQVLRDDLAAPVPGQSGILEFFTSPTASDAARKRLTAVAVVAAVTHDLSRTKGALRTITLIAISPDGAADPITIEDADSAPAP